MILVPRRFWCVKKVPIGIHERWAGDGHDKLYKIGFPIWAVIDDATGKWLDAWVIPSNRIGVIIGYLFLCLVEKFSSEFISLSSFGDAQNKPQQEFHCSS